MLADLHIHTRFSDGKLHLREVVDRFGSRGYDVIAITDHLCEERTVLGRAARFLNRTLTRESFPFYIHQIRKEAERAWDLYKMIVLPGFEITKNSIQNHRSAHILAVGVEQYISPELDVIDLSKRIRSAGGLAIAAHPISMGQVRKGNYFLWDQRHELRSHFDAWEITDNGHILKEVLESDLPKIANSDFHSLRQSAAWRSILHGKKNRESVLESVRTQNLSFRFVGS